MTDTDTVDTGTQQSDDAAVVAAAIQGDDTTQGTTEETQEAQGAWNFDEDIPGNGEVPEWFKSDKYKTVAEQAKAYKELEGRMGAFTGAPEKYEPPKINKEITGKGVEIDTDDPLIETAMEYAKKMNMSQDGFNELINLYGETMIAEQMALEEYKQDQLKALGGNAESRLNNLNNWANKNLSPELYQNFQGLATSADAVQTLERLVAMTRPAAINPTHVKASTGVTTEELQELQFAKDEYGNRKMNNPEYRKMVEQKFNEHYGTEQFREQVGS